MKGSESKTGDNLLECKIQSDAKDYEVSAPRVVSEDMFETASPSVPSFIILPQSQILEGKTIIAGRSLKAQRVTEYHVLILYEHLGTPLG